jgi:aminoglycoside phosphotransferase family enzyme/predicted kinase
VELNRRIAPGAYLGVWDVVGPDGQPREHLVVMRRMPEERRLSTLVRDGAAVADEVREIARVMAAFHAEARRGPEISREGSRDAIRQRWMDSFEQTRRFRGDVLDEPTALEIESETLEFLAGRQALFARRIAEQRIVDGHADLLAEDIFCLPEGPQLLDCIEFDDRLRYVDGLDDIAFLAMDLERLGQPELGGRLLDWYGEFAADPAPTSLRHHFVAYRAFVRAKVACLRHAQGDRGAAADVARHAALTVEHLRRGRVSLILVGGAPATGKSTLAGALADELGAVVLSTDRIRKELVGLDPLSSAAAGFGEGIYTPQWTERTYGELLRRAGLLLGLGETVILDASWTDAGHRQRAAAVAGAAHSGLVSLRCAADPEIVASRLRGRATGLSDADQAIADRMRHEADPWPEAITVEALTVPDATALALKAVGRH